MKKPWLIILVVVLGLALIAMGAAIALDIARSKPSEAKLREHSIEYFYSDTEGVTHFLADSELLSDHVAGTVDAFITCDGTVAAARAGTGLYRIDKEGVTMIHPVGVDRALLSLDNRYIVYTTATEVHVYDNETGRVEDVKPDDIVGVASIVISPSGETVGYSVKNKEGEFCAYAYENGESRLLKKNAYIMAVGDGAEFYYYIEPEGVGLYYSEGRREKKIGSNVSSLLEFNRELTEVIFDMNGSTYASVNGGSARELAEGASVYCASASCESVQGGESCTSSVKDIATLWNGVFYAERSSADASRSAYDVWYVDPSRRATALVKGTEQFFISRDGSTLSCIVDRTLYKLPVRDPQSREVVANNVWSFSVSPDANDYYCVGYDMGLYYITGKSVAVKRAENVVYSVLTGDGRCLYLSDYSSTGKLYSFTGGGEIAYIAGGVFRVETEPGLCYYHTAYYEDEFGVNACDIYVSADGVNFEKAVEAVPYEEE